MLEALEGDDLVKLRREMAPYDEFGPALEVIGHKLDLLLHSTDQLKAMVKDISARLDEKSPPDITRLQPRPTERRTAPLWLPRRNEDFVDREQQLERLTNTLRGRKTAGIFGMGGVGKTALANEAVYRLTDDFKESGIIWQSNGHIALRGLLETIVQAYENLPLLLWRELDHEQRLARARKWLVDRRPLFCLDDVRESELVRQVLEIAPECAVLVTSRHHLDTVEPLLREVIDLDLDCLAPSEAVQLLEHRLGWSLNRTQKTVAQQICKTVGFLPLAIELVAARLRIGKTPLDRMLDRLREHKTLLDELQVEDKSVRASFAVTYDDLEPEEKQLFATLGFFAGVISLDRALVVSVCDIPEVEKRLENLAIRSLLKVRDKQVEIHPLLHLFAQEKLEKEWGKALQRAVAQSLLSYVTSLSSDDRRRLSVEIRLGIEWCVHRKQLDLVIEYVKALSDFWLANGYWRELYTYIPQALDAARTLGSRIDEALLMHWMGRMYQAAKEPTRALYWQTRALELEHYLKHWPGEARSLLAIGDLYKELGDLSRSLEYHLKAFDLFQSVGDQESITVVTTSLADTYARLADVPLAASFAQTALETVMKLGYPVEREDLFRVYEMVVSVLIEQGRATTEAFEHIERFRGRSFLDQLAVSPLPAPPGVSTPLIALERDLQRQVQQLSTAAKQAVGKQRDGLEKRLRELREKLTSVWAQIEMSAPEYVALRQPRPVSLADVRGLAMGADKKRVVLAEYFMAQDATYLFVIRADFDEPRVYEIKQPIDAVRQFVVQFVAERTRGDVVTVRPGDKVRHLDETAYQNLFGPFVDPIREWADEGDIVWLVPHDVLHYLPLHAFKVEGRYLIERNPVCYTPSASVMKYCHAKRKGRRENALVLGDSRDDLLHAREEALTVAELFDTTPYLGSQATKSLVKEKLEEERDELDILHFACHGYFDPYQALKSSIMLAIEQDDDGAEGKDERKWNLTVEEIFGLEMRADLVTLSADASGINERRPGDELIGLTRAFLYAGTPSVVACLWAPDELSTTFLMEAFYRGLKDGLSKAEALQAAQLFVKNLTAQQVVDYCAQRLAAFTDSEDVERVLRFQLDKANAQAAAGDLKPAITTYRNVQARLGTLVGEHVRKLAAQVAQTLPSLEFKAEAAPAVNYDTKPFDRPYHWAPFILVGDWK